MDAITVRRSRRAPVVRRRRSVITLHPIASRTVLTKQALAFSTGSTFFPEVMLWQAADAVLGNSFVASNKDYLFARNNSGSERTVTLRSVPDPAFGRFGDLSIVIEPNGTAVFGPIGRLGWAQSNGLIYVDAQAADVDLLPMTFA